MTKLSLKPARADRYQSVASAFRIYRALQTRPMTVPQLADWLSLNRLTVRRLLEAMQTGGVRLVTKRQVGTPGEAVLYSIKEAR